MEDFIIYSKAFTQTFRNFAINNLLKKYKFLNAGSIGNSLCGRTINYIRLGSKKNMCLWVGAHHGTEWLTSMIMLKFLNKICFHINRKEKFCGIDFGRHFEENGLVMVPCLNPDGVEISLLGSKAAGKYSPLVYNASRGNTGLWQANARGVDLNHNYSADWEKTSALEKENGICGPSATRFGGVKPHSEPETRALTNFCEKNHFRYSVAFHSQGEEIYWNYGPYVPAESEKMAQILCLACNYELSVPQGLACGGGFKDWFITHMKKPGFTIEIGKGKNPLPVSDLQQVYDKIEKMLFILSVM